MGRAIHWFRNDLRLSDNTALGAAAESADELALVFVVDPLLVRRYADCQPRLRFLAASLAALRDLLESRGQRLILRRGEPAAVLARLADDVGAERVHWNRDTTPYARRRDDAVRSRVERSGVRVFDAVDRVALEGSSVRTRAGGPYSVYGPYRRTWEDRWLAELRTAVRAPQLPPPVAGLQSDVDSLEAAFGVEAPSASTEGPEASESAARRRLREFVAGPIAAYETDRDRPAVDGTSRLSPYLRFGLVSIRECLDAAREALRADPRIREGAKAWVGELVWREFYAAVLEERPTLLQAPFRPETAAIRWNDDPEGFAAWCRGETGFPLVDAGMRQLAVTGWMHNRVRMVVASFLAKDLLVDWRLGEAHFMRALVDGDPASNDGGWQWAASTGTDAQPYFRIFNPIRQGLRFDPEGAYVRRWVPELAGVGGARVHEPWKVPGGVPGYPSRIVDHAERRLEAIARYEAARIGS